MYLHLYDIFAVLPLRMQILNDKTGDVFAWLCIFCEIFELKWTDF